jgi:parvulin-like peptidyl-prolyl isomerase
MGNDILRGVAWADVARQGSTGPTAQQGGQRDWTTQGSLASQALDGALFSLPLNVPSQILEDERGFHIIRVLERVDAGRVPFRDAQVKIKEQIDKDRQQKAVQEYQAKLRKETHVWTVFDDPDSAQRFAESQRTRKR